MVNGGIRDGYPSRPIGGNYSDIFRTRRETGGWRGGHRAVRMPKTSVKKEAQAGTVWPRRQPNQQATPGPRVPATGRWSGAKTHQASGSDPTGSRSKIGHRTRQQSRRREQPPL